MSELFKESEVSKLSPKLEWMRRHGIVTGTDPFPRVVDGKEMPRTTYAATIVTYAATEEDALLMLAEKLDIKHYKVEQHEKDQAAAVPIWE